MARRILPTPTGMLQGERWRQLLVAWAWRHKFTNMACKSLSALTRQAFDGDDVEIVEDSGPLRSVIRDRVRRAFDRHVGDVMRPAS